MKCVQNMETKLISRVSDTVADKLVASGKHKYVPKLQWKQQEGKVAERDGAK